MNLFINVHGTHIANPYEESDSCGEFCRFQYYRSVLDGSSLFRRKLRQTDGGTDNNGITEIFYTSSNDCQLYLDIDGGFPVPELADMTFRIQSISETCINDLIRAFEEYHRVKFAYHELSCEENWVWLNLYESRP